MKKIQSVLQSVATLAALLFPFVSYADGMIMPPPDVYVYETAQTAAIFYETDTQTETLAVSIDYEGTAEDFAWMIPTPTKPEVERGSRTLFSALDELTLGYDYDYSGYSESSAFDLGVTAEPTVTVVEEKQVEYYDVTVLEATSATDLVEWLNDNGYSFPQKYTYILTDYVESGWYFTAMRITALAADADVTTKLNTGQAVPVQLTFTTENLVYPLRISSIVKQDTGLQADTDTITSEPTAQPAAVALTEPLTDDYYDYYDDYQTITLYVITDHKMEAPLFYTDYADKVQAEDVESWGSDTNGNPWVEPQQDKYYLTKLTATLTAADMTDDVFPVAAEDNDEVNYDYYGYDWDAEDIATVILLIIVVVVLFFAALVVSPFGVTQIITTVIRARATSAGWRLAAHCVQWLNTAGFLCLSVLLWIVLWDELIDDLDYYWEYSYDKSEIGGTLGLLLGNGIALVCLAAVPIIQTIVMLWQRKHKPSTQRKPSRKSTVA